MVSFNRVFTGEQNCFELPQMYEDIFQANAVADEKNVPVFLSVTRENIYTLLHTSYCHQSHRRSLSLN